LSEENNAPDTSRTEIREAGELTYRLQLPQTPSAGGAPVLIMIHGYGANDGDIYELVPYIDPTVLIAAPRGPGRYNDAARGSFKWYDMDLQTCQAPPDSFGPSIEKLLQFIPALSESAGVTLDPQRLFIGGFSQGAVMALAVAAQQPELFAGIVCHSCPFSPELHERLQQGAAGLAGKPVFLAHGETDFLPIAEHGRKVAETLREIGTDLTYNEYAFGHETSPQSRRDLANWLNPRL
jgi:phospholipase/carboxylesterase